MTMKVLQERRQINDARRELVSIGASSLESPSRSLLHRLGLFRPVAVGDEVKSWDVLATLEFLEENVERSEPILDIGCYASEVIVSLHRLGYTNLTGIDLNPRVLRMPHNQSVRYRIADFTRTELPAESFQAITSISVIEHGFNGKLLLSEISRLLRPGGYFVASFDYWPEKVDTTGIKFFGMDWLVFSKDDVHSLISEAAAHDLTPVGEIQYEAKEKAIECGGRQYTFAWLVLRKTV